MAKTININKAGPDEFEEVDGIDKEMAMQIVEFRHKNGDFQKLADLEKVPGLDGGVLHYLKSHAFVESAQISFPPGCAGSSPSSERSEASESQQNIGQAVNIDTFSRDELMDMDSVGEELDRFIQLHGIRTKNPGEEGQAE